MWTRFHNDGNMPTQYVARVRNVVSVPGHLPFFLVLDFIIMATCPHNMRSASPWRSIGTRPSPGFSPRLRDNIWEWPGNEARVHVRLQCRTVPQNCVLRQLRHNKSFLPIVHMGRTRVTMCRYTALYLPPTLTCSEYTLFVCPCSVCRHEPSSGFHTFTR